MTTWPASVRVAAAATAVVALASAVLSWDALTWGAGQLGIDGRLAWLYPVAVDGCIMVGTAAAWALRHAPRRVRAYVWGLLGIAIGASVVGNAAHAAGGNPLHSIGGAVPAAALAGSLHLLIVLVRHVHADRPANEVHADPVIEPVMDRPQARPAIGTAEAIPPATDRPARRPATGHGTATRAAKLLAKAPAMTSTEAAKRLGVSDRTARRLLAAARRPHVVEDLAKEGAQ